MHAYTVIKHLVPDFPVTYTVDIVYKNARLYTVIKHLVPDFPATYTVDIVYKNARLYTAIKHLVPDFPVTYTVDIVYKSARLYCHKTFSSRLSSNSKVANFEKLIEEENVIRLRALPFACIDHPSCSILNVNMIILEIEVNHAIRKISV